MNPPSPASSTPRPRYQKIQELGRNRAGGRITYLAKDNQTQQLVVIKRFLFARAGSDWSEFKAYEREIQVLQGLEHPGIPRYRDSFETKAGFCMVQEYKKAQSLAIPRSFEPEQIKQIAIATLEILVYLQCRLPVVIHRDIKPENLLVDEQLNVYLVDFGLARLGGSNVAMSSVAAGTFGFMAPEQIYNHKLTKATDLYGLGATLISLLTGTKSTAMDTLINEEGRIHFQHLLPQLSLRFVNWLETMVRSKQSDA
jgi:serine/threonine protein kinase